MDEADYQRTRALLSSGELDMGGPKARLLALRLIVHEAEQEDSDGPMGDELRGWVSFLNEVLKKGGEA